MKCCGQEAIFWPRLESSPVVHSNQGWKPGLGRGENWGHVAGTHRLLDLPLVDLQLVLQLLHQLLHALVGLVVLLRLEDQLFEAPLILPQRLDRFHMLFLLPVQLRLQFFDLGEEERNAAGGTQVFELQSSVALGRGVAVSTSCPEVSPAQEGWVGSAFHQQVVRCLEPQVSSSGKWGRQGWDKVTDPLGPSSSDIP